MLYNHAKFCIAGVEVPVSDAIQVSGGLLTTKLSFVLTDKEAYLASPMARSRFEDVPVRLYISKPFNSIPDSIPDSDYITVFDGSASLTLAYNPVTMQLDIGVTARPGSVAAFSSVLYSELSIGLLTTANTAGDVAVIEPEFVNEGISATVTGTGLNNMNSILFLKRLVDGKKAQDISRPTDILDFAVHNLLTYAEARTGTVNETVTWCSNGFTVNSGKFVEDAVQAVADGEADSNLFLKDIILREDLSVELRKVSDEMSTNYWNKLIKDYANQLMKIAEGAASLIKWQDYVPVPGFLDRLTRLQDEAANYTRAQLRRLRKYEYSSTTLTYIPFNDTKVSTGRSGILHATNTDLWFPAESFSTLWTDQDPGSADKKSAQEVKVNKNIPKQLVDAIKEADVNLHNSSVEAGDGGTKIIFGVDAPNAPEILVILNEYIRSYLLTFGMYCIKSGSEYKNVLDIIFNTSESEKSGTIYTGVMNAVVSGIPELLSEALTNLKTGGAELTRKYNNVSHVVMQYWNDGSTPKDEYLYTQQVKCAYPGNGTYSWSDVKQTGNFVWNKVPGSPKTDELNLETDCPGTWLGLAENAVSSGVRLGLNAVTTIANFSKDFIPFYVLPNNPSVKIDFLPVKNIQKVVVEIYKELQNRDLVNTEDNLFKNAKPTLFDLRAASKMVDWSVYNRMGTLGFMRLAYDQKTNEIERDRIFPNLKLVELQELQQLVAGQATSSGNGGTISLMELLQRVTSVLHLGLTTPLNKAYAIQNPVKPYAVGSSVPGLEYTKSVTELMLLPVAESWCVPRCNVMYVDKSLPVLENYDRTRNTTNIIVKYDPPIAAVPGADGTTNQAIPSQYYTFDLLNPGRLIEWKAVSPDNNKVYSYEVSSGYSTSYKAGYLYDMYRTQMISVNRELALLSELCCRVAQNKTADGESSKSAAESDTFGFSYSELGALLSRLNVSGSLDGMKSAIEVVGRFTKRSDVFNVEQGYRYISPSVEYAIFNDKSNTLKIAYVKTSEGLSSPPESAPNWLNAFSAGCAQVALAFLSEHKDEVKRTVGSTDLTATRKFIENMFNSDNSASALENKFYGEMAVYLKGYVETIDLWNSSVSYEDSVNAIKWFGTNEDGYHRFTAFVSEMAKPENTDDAKTFLSKPWWSIYLAKVYSVAGVNSSWITGVSVHSLQKDISPNNLVKLQNELVYKGEGSQERLTEFVGTVTDDSKLSLGVLASYGILDTMADFVRITMESLLKKLIFMQAYKLGYIDGLAKSLQASPPSLPDRMTDQEFLANAIAYDIHVNTDGWELAIDLVRRSYSGILKGSYQQTIVGSTEEADSILSDSEDIRSIKIKNYFSMFNDMKDWGGTYQGSEALQKTRREEFLKSVLDSDEVASGKPSKIIRGQSLLASYLLTGYSFVKYTGSRTTSSGSPYVFAKPYFCWYGDITAGMENKDIPKPSRAVGLISAARVPESVSKGNIVYETSKSNQVTLDALDRTYRDLQTLLVNIDDAESSAATGDNEFTALFPTWPFIVWFNHGKTAAVVNMNLTTGAMTNLCNLRYITSELVTSDKEFYYFDLSGNDQVLNNYYLGGSPSGLLDFINKMNPWPTTALDIPDNAYVAFPIPMSKSGNPTLNYYAETVRHVTAQLLRGIKQTFGTTPILNSHLDPRRELGKIMQSAVKEYIKTNTVSTTTVKSVPKDNAASEAKSEGSEPPSQEPVTSPSSGVSALMAGTASASERDVSLTALFPEYDPARRGNDQIITYLERPITKPVKSNRKTVNSYTFYKGQVGSQYLNNVAAIREEGVNLFKVHSGFDVFMVYNTPSKALYKPYDPAHRKVRIAAPFDCVVAYGYQGNDTKMTGFGFYAIVMPLVDNYLSWNSDKIPGLLIAHLDPVLTFNLIKTEIPDGDTYSDAKGTTLYELKNSEEMKTLSSMAATGITGAYGYYFGKVRNALGEARSLTPEEQEKLKNYITNLKAVSKGQFLKTMIKVKKGNAFAYMGSSGGSEGWHAHINCRLIPITDKIRQSLASFYSNANPGPIYQELFVSDELLKFKALDVPIKDSNGAVTGHHVPWSSMVGKRDDILKKYIYGRGFGDFDKMLPDIMAKVSQAQAGMNITFAAPIVPMSANGDATTSTVAESLAEPSPELITSVAASAAYQESMRRLCTVQPDPIILPYYDPYVVDGTMPGAVIYRNDLVLTKVMSYTAVVNPRGIIQSQIMFSPGISVRRMLPMYLKALYELKTKPYPDEQKDAANNLYKSWTTLSVFPFHALNFYNKYAYSTGMMNAQYKDMFGKESFVFDWRNVVDLRINNEWYSVKTIVDGSSTEDGKVLLKTAADLNYSYIDETFRINVSTLSTGLGMEPKNEASLLLDYRAWNPENLFTENLVESTTFDPKGSNKVASSYAEGNDYEAESMQKMDTALSSIETAITMPKTFYDWSALFKRLRKTVITPKHRFK